MEGGTKYNYLYVFIFIYEFLNIFNGLFRLWAFTKLNFSHFSTNLSNP
jgi:hypothetical protein